MVKGGESRGNGSLTTGAIILWLGAGFFGNVLAVIGVVSWMTEPLGKAYAEEKIQLAAVRAELGEHEQLVGHAGETALRLRLEGDVAWIRHYLETHSLPIKEGR